ncbi:MAG: rod shape-determining protein MreC [Acidimicrobiales bacterium]
MAASRRQNNRFVLVVLVLLGVTLVTLSTRGSDQGIFNKVRAYARQVADPFQSAVHSALEPVGNFLYGAFNYGSLERENQLLRQELVAAQTAQVQAASEQAQAQQVLAQAHLDYLGAVPTVAAQVVGLGSANFEQTIEVNRGSDNGLAVGEPVVAAGGLVGSVSSVSAHLSTVTLLDDPSFTVGVEVVSRSSTPAGKASGKGKTGRAKGPSSVSSGAAAVANGGSVVSSGGAVVVGAATGQGAGNALSVQGVDVGANVKRGDELVTSGLQLEHFPGGIPVGTVTSVYAPPGALQLSISMQPFVDLGDLQVVQVLLWSAQSG